MGCRLTCLGSHECRVLWDGLLLKLEGTVTEYSPAEIKSKCVHCEKHAYAIYSFFTVAKKIENEHFCWYILSPPGDQLNCLVNGTRHQNDLCHGKMTLYLLEPPRRSNEYPQSTFWNKKKQNRYTPVYPCIHHFFLYLSGV